MDPIYILMLDIIPANYDSEAKESNSLERLQESNFQKLNMQFSEGEFLAMVKEKNI